MGFSSELNYHNFIILYSLVDPTSNNSQVLVPVFIPDPFIETHSCHEGALLAGYTPRKFFSTTCAKDVITWMNR